MAKFNITVPDGRQVMVDAANAQDAAEAADTWANQGRSPARVRAYADAQKRSATAPGIEKAVDNGFTFNTAGDLDALLAGGETGIHNFIAHATGQPDAGYGMSEARQAVSDVERNAAQRFGRDHPVQNVAGTILGAVANPVNKLAGRFVAGAPNLLGATLRSGATAAPIGAAYGAFGANPGERGRGAVTGGLTGAAVGLAAPPLLAGAGALLNAGKGAVGDMVSGARNLIAPPDPEAAAAFGDTDAAMGKLSDLARAKGVDIPQLADATGKGMTTAEAMGRPAVSSLGALARRSGTTPDLLEAQLRSRAAGMAPGILDDFSAVSGLHPDEAAGNVEALAGRLQKEAGPLYDAVRADPSPVWNVDLAKLSERPAIRKAIDAAGKSMLNAGQDPLAVGLKVDPDTGAYVLNPDLSQSTEAVPTAATWDKVKKMVGALVQRDPVTGKVIRTGEVGIQNGDFATASRDLTTALAGDPAHGVPGAIPGYRAALDKAGDYLSLQDAFDRAQNTFLKPGVSAKAFGEAYRDLSEPEQKAWLAGVSAKLSDQVQAGRLTPRMLMLPHVQGKLAAVLGDGPASDFLAHLSQRAGLAATGARMMPGAGSPTMELLNAANEQDAGPAALNLAVRALRRPGSTAVDLWNAGQSRIGSPQVRNELGRLLMQSPEDTAAEFGAWSPPMKTAITPPRLPYPAAAGVTASAMAGRRK